MKEGNMKPLPDKVIISCAITGIAANRKQCPYIPYTPEEMANEALRAYNAGATIVHIHAREDDGSPTVSVSRFREIRDAIRQKCPILLNFATGAVGIPIQERVEHIRQLQPEIGALNMGSINYAIYSEKKKQFYFDEVFANPFQDILYLAKIMQDANVKPECECFDAGHIANTLLLMEMGKLPTNVNFSLVFGVYGAIQASPQNLIQQINLLPPNAIWQAIGVSLGQWHILATALAAGGHVRVGFEDNFYLSKNKMAKSNAQLVEKAVQLAQLIGREPTTLKETKEILF
ncbi:MAG: 3-keto-5-aminohexanoate cleavage protein [Planctomycetota bacterium]|nr:MAG: 3-keto-5-aminohexanoate cleavage protein [Planctomycetota bacterium]